MEALNCVIGKDFVYFHTHFGMQIADCEFALALGIHGWLDTYFGITWDTRVCIAFRAGGCSSLNVGWSCVGLGTNSRLCFEF